MTAVLDNAPVAIYVSATDNWELLYANHLATEIMMQNSGTVGTTCYSAAGFREPCPFCNAKKMSGTELMVREFHHPSDGRIYQLSGKLIDWEGRPAHIEYIMDITEKKREEDSAKALKELLQVTFSSIPCGLCVYRHDGKKILPLFHNPAFYSIMGYSEENIRNVEQSTSFLGVHPEDLERLVEAVKQAVRCSGLVHQTYRVFNDRKQEYRWIHLEGSVKTQPDGTKLLYGVYSDVSDQQRLEKELAAANEKLQDIINAIPGGVAIYKIRDIFETVYFSDGVPALTGYSVEEYKELCRRDAAEMTYPEDTPMVMAKVMEAVQNHGVVDCEFRKRHRDGHIIWVRVQAKVIGEENGYPLLYCIFHNISDIKEAQLELDHLVNSIPGGIASYRVENGCFIPVFISDGVMALSGHTREEYNQVLDQGVFGTIYEQDRERLAAAVQEALLSGEVLDVSYRMYHKDGHMIWIHLNGRRMGPLSNVVKFYVVFTGMSEETHLYQKIANETADGIYVIDKRNYDLLYANESKDLFMQEKDCVGKKCFSALHGKSAPCEYCTLAGHEPDGVEHEMRIEGSGRFYSTRFRETNWNGIPAYVKSVRDVTEEVLTRKEKERLEQYFQTMVKNMPGGLAVVRYEKDGSMVPEFLSDGFVAMTGMSMEEAWQLYGQDAMTGVHPEDKQSVNDQMNAYIAGGESHCELVYRLKKGKDDYVWVKNTLSLIQNEDGEGRVYAVYHDITKEREEREKIRRQYKDMILQHYKAPDPNALIIGHCNITRNVILEIIDHTDSDLLKTFGTVRETFFSGLSTLVVDEKERQQFLNTYLNKPALDAFKRNETEQILRCFVRLPREETGRYVQFKVNLVETPDSGDITGILTVTDITVQTVTDKILHQLSVTSHDFVIDLDLLKDTYTVLTHNRLAESIPETGSHSRWIANVRQTSVVPRDKELYFKSLEPEEMKRRLAEEGPYTFTYSLADEKGDIRTKNMTVSAVDLRLGRVCLVRTDITDSVREQQGLLNMMAYTFELMGFIDIHSNRFTMYTRKTVLENLSPYVEESYDSSVDTFKNYYEPDMDISDIKRQFSLDTMLQKLEEKPSGYDFVLPYPTENGLRYKQINVLWGDDNRRTVCMVRADVTDMLAAERESKKTLKDALGLAEEASQAKSDFLSAMSHDIRTPMNAIMGMTTLAAAHLDDRGRVADCLEKISISSKHLLSLINDILDMSKIERSKITLNRMKISLSELTAQLSAIMMPQARAAGIRFVIKGGNTAHAHFYGDRLRINQILINILSNAVKFTPEGGRVDFLIEEVSPLKEGNQVRYRFTVRDTGIGMTKEFLSHIFEPFNRSGSVSRVEGTGLGLSITKGLVDLMGGSLSVESRLGKGTDFQVELEFETAEADAEIGLSDANPGFGEGENSRLFAGRRFLIAEDNAINAEILCELLAMYGAESVVRTDGRQAVDEFGASARGTYDAVLMDVQMPVMNGYEATRAIRRMNRPDAAAIPIVAMTANAFAEDVQAAQDAGMTAHVAKPIDLEVLKNTLGKVLKQRE
ncbi:PAS domain-containing protein [Clostridium sp. MCC353]|nr:PAS domain-containing protein [Clostridium sp. MCC353]